MSQPVKLSDALVLDARLTADLSQRSIAGQIEFWAQLGRAIEPLLRTPELLALRRAGETRPLSELIAEVGTPTGSAKLADHLAARPFPHYEPGPPGSGLILRIDEDGTRTLGRFVQRRFEAAPDDGAR